MTLAHTVHCCPTGDNQLLVTKWNMSLILHTCEGDQSGAFSTRGRGSWYKAPGPRAFAHLIPLPALRGLFLLRIPPGNIRGQLRIATFKKQRQGVPR